MSVCLVGVVQHEGHFNYNTLAASDLRITCTGHDGLR